MFTPTLLLILGGCALGLFQLSAGIAIGMWLRRADSTDDQRCRQDMIQASEIAKRLQALADEMSSSVGEHRSQLDQASQLLTSEQVRTDESLAELVVDVIGDIVRANQNLQTKLDTAENRLEEQAVEIEAHISRSLTDPLTGLPNRREFNNRLEERMAAWSRRREEFTLVLLDVDHFKKLNDQYGHLAGDQVLAAIGRALRGAVRREDAVARYGGEEFAILLPNTTLDQATKVAENVRQAVAGAIVKHNGHEIAVTISGGLAMIGTSESAESLIERADAALYTAKAAGRDRAFLHDGTACRAATDFQIRAVSPAGLANELVELINSTDADCQTPENSCSDDAHGFGFYLPREEVSAELAKSCEELRRYVEAHSQRQLETASISRS